MIFDFRFQLDDIVDDLQHSRQSSTSSSATHLSSHQQRKASKRNLLMEVDSRHALRELDWSDLQVGESIGSGAFGEVFKATLDGETVAVKRLVLPEDPVEQKSLISEFDVSLNCFFLFLFCFCFVCVLFLFCLCFVCVLFLFCFCFVFVLDIV